MRRKLFCVSRMVLAILPVCFLLSCLGSSGIRTMIHQSPKSIVYLEWVSRESFRASHPVTPSPTTIRRLLRGVLVQPPSGILKAMLGGQPELSHMFSDEDVETLLPHILAALSQATPEEHVVFQRMSPLESERVMTAGTLYIHEGLLFLTLTRYGKKSDKPAIILYKGNRETPDTTGLRDAQVSFQPKTVWRTEHIPESNVSGYNSAKTLVIDYPLLAQLPNTVFPILRDEETISPAGPIRVRDPIDDTKKERELKGLREQMRTLQDQLSDMEMKIEGLKGKKKFR